MAEILRFSICVLILCGLVQGLSISAKPSQDPVRGDAKSKSTDTRRVALYEGMVSFVPPEGFSRMSEEVMAVKFPDLKGPAVVYGNSETTVSIAITFPPQLVLSLDQLPDFKTYMESLIAKQKEDLKWLRKEFVEVNGRRWIHFEFLSSAVDTQIHNHMYLTSLDERMLAFNFNATVEDYAGYKDALERSKDSIQTGK